MNNRKTELAVAALKDGTVIDHIPSESLFKCVKILDLENLPNQLTIGNNLHSDKLSKKGIIKIADITFPEDRLNRVAIIAPSAVVNIIRDYEVVEKRRVVLPETIIGLVRCNNPKCVTNNEPMKTKHDVIDRAGRIMRCHYCGHTVECSKADII